MNNTNARTKAENDIVSGNWTKSENDFLGDVSFLTFIEASKNFLLTTNEITYIQADHVYVRIFTTHGKRFLLRCSLGNLLKKLPINKFIQTHRSYIVNLNFVKDWNNEKVFLQDKIIPISRSRKKLFSRKINQYYEMV